MKPLLLWFAAVVALPMAAAVPAEALRLWPAAAPGETATLPPETDTTTEKGDLVAGRRVIRLGNVSDPTLTIYRASAATDPAPAVLVCPGGGYWILAMDLEGTEICEWLNSIGVTAALLKYRVPARPGLPRYVPPLQDAQRAMGLLRARSAEWGIDPDRIGVLGFSAGAHLAATLSNHDATRTYPAVDSADAVNCRPDFVVLIYPGLLAKPSDGLSPEVRPKPEETPPTFIVMAEDDPVDVENALAYYTALSRAKIPAEMHLYPAGGHGYGLRKSPQLVTSWPDRATDWLKVSGWLGAAKSGGSR